MAQKLKIKEIESQRAVEKADGIECKFIEIEDELKVVGQKQQNLEVGEEKSLGREEVLQKQIKELLSKLSVANARSVSSSWDLNESDFLFVRKPSSIVIFLGLKTW